VSESMIDKLVWTAIVDLLNIADADEAILEQSLAVKLLRAAGGGWADGLKWVTPERMAALPRCDRCREPFEGPAGPCTRDGDEYRFGQHISGSMRWCEGCGEFFDIDEAVGAFGCSYYPDGEHRQDARQALIDRGASA
jgi:hypothetical protein